jgi:methyltransferase, FkbM family
MLQKIKEAIKNIIFSFIKPPVNNIFNTYAQAGEDVIMKFLFDGRNIKMPSYLDIGVNSPDIHNNTFLFYKNGASGVCIEANIDLIEKIKQVRPRDKTINVGVGVQDTNEADFYVFSDSGLNTFNKEEALNRQSYGINKIQQVIKVRLVSINEIISENFLNYPDLLSIDIEGLDLEVLKTLDLKKFPIPVICVETCTYSESHIKPKDYKIIDFMLSSGYEVYGDTYINTIFVNKNWFYS